MGVEVAGGSAELGRERHGQEHLLLFAQSCREDGDLLAQAGGRSGLAVGVGQHGDVLPVLCHAVQHIQHLVKLRQVHVLYALHKAEGHGSIVDVLRCQAEMHELLESGIDAQAVKLPFYVVFHGLDIVVGGLLNLLHLGCLVLGHVAVYRAESVEQAVVEAAEQGELGVI